MSSTGPFGATPDETYEAVTYTRLDLAEKRDRLGRVTRYVYDASRRRIATRDPLGRTITQAWCACGSLDALIDANGNRTRWERDARGRVTREVRADGATFCPPSAPCVDLSPSWHLAGHRGERLLHESFGTTQSNEIAVLAAVVVRARTSGCKRSPGREPPPAQREA